jgi:hypothetical protein
VREEREMPKLADLVSTSSVEAFRGYAIDVASEMENTNKKNGAVGRFSFWQLVQRQPELSENIIRMIWAEMWSHAKPHSGLPSPYTHVVPYSFSVNPIVVRMFSEFDEAVAGKRAGFQAAAVRKIMAKNRIAMPRHGTGKSEYYIRYLPPTERIIFEGAYAYVREDYRDAERRIEEEEKAEKTVVVRFDLSKLAPPDPSPEGMVTWAEKVIGAFKNLERRFNELSERHTSLMEKAAAMEAELEKYTNRAEYGEAAAQIARMLSGQAEAG